MIDYNLFFVPQMFIQVMCLPVYFLLPIYLLRYYIIQ
jgi:hypothetical protein